MNGLYFLFHIRCYIFAQYKSVVIVFLLYRFGIYDDECIGILLSFLWTLVICFPSTFMNWVCKNFDGLSSIFKLLIAWKTSSNSSFLVVKNIAHVSTIKQRFYLTGNINMHTVPSTIWPIFSEFLIFCWLISRVFKHVSGDNQFYHIYIYIYIERERERDRETERQRDRERNLSSTIVISACLINYWSKYNLLFLCI